uniref:hypothetical protein n=1 Tax=Prevotella sp. TaxID=59823 RepID=UPI003FEE614B
MTSYFDKAKAVVAMAIAAGLQLSCSGISGDEKEMIEHDVLGFSEAYFNFDLKGAASYCTDDSRKWISYVASNIQESDIEAMRSKESDATVSIVDISFNNSDSTGTALIKVNNALVLDTIGKPGHTVDEAHYRLDFICKEGKCLIRMACPLRNER